MKQLIKLIIGICITLFLFYLWTPSINSGSWGFWFTLLVGAIIIAVMGIDFDYDEHSKINFLPLILIVVSMLFLSIRSCSVFRADDYQKILGETVDSDFTKDIAPISEMEMRVIDEEIANKLGDKTLGEDPSLGSVAEVNGFTLQSVNRKLYYIAPLEHSGFFKWYNNGYTTGYIKVSATNQNDISLVQEVNGKPIKIKYQPSAYFGEDLYRHIWSNGYRTSLLTDIQFEIDDEGYPWWIVTRFEKKVTMGGSEAIGCLVVNPETGEIKEHSISETPKWIDRVQPIDFIKTQIDDWGEYIHGWWNFSGRDKLRSSSGATVVYGNDDQCYVYTGITSVGSDEGTVGFMMVNTVTKKVFRYNRTGATEEAAKRSAESQVQEKSYKATFPIPYNVNGTPTYFMSLVGNDGLPKMYSMVSIQNYNIVGVGDNLISTLRSYQRALTSKGNATGIESSFERKELQGSIKRISNDISDGQTSYYFILESSNIIFRGSSDISVEIPLSKEGDVLKITYDDSGQPVTQIVSFDNLEIEMVKSSINEEKSKYFKKVDSINFQKNEFKNANQVLENLTDEEKLKLLKKHEE